MVTAQLLVPILTLLAGLLLGWLLGARPGATLRAERDRLDERLRDAERRLAAAEERAQAAPLLRATLDEVTRERDAALRAQAASEAAADAQRLAAEARLTELREAREALARQFNEIGGQLLGEAQRAFLERADQRFAQADEKAGEKLKALLAPVESTLKRYEEGVARVEKERSEAYGTLTSLIGAMREGQEAVRGEAARLVNVFRAAPKARGRWGEQQLRNVLETCGLAEHTDFEMEVSVATDEGRLRPDAVIRVPRGGALVIDAKVSLNAYQDAFDAVDEGERARHLALHAAAMKAHVTALSGKSYWSQFESTPEFVVMFVPGEHFLAAATDSDPTLWDYAFQRRVLLAAPTNLVALARTVAGVWRQETLAREAVRIGELGKEMYERLVVASGHLKRVGGGLNSAVENYNKFLSSFDGRVLVTARRFKELNIDTGGKEIEPVVPVDALARVPMSAELGAEPAPGAIDDAGGAPARALADADAGAASAGAERRTERAAAD
ncbi:DNA recombination protein RmuC [Sphingomonas morindae]|uniref:DNA recombination protein RmuC homolog n=1 Tax=Sphingomonas morindae TaxID=1541170 RepID=A0ABY4X7Q0_9SPHN|nr:DNA recombination protein RmuC [Sphingomonas morindae]USI72939.1 DNA recombination protein RmuC [Sphingomonas morindae]